MNPFLSGVSAKARALLARTVPTLISGAVLSIAFAAAAVSAATTISTNISTGGTLSVSGASALATTTFSGHVGIGTTTAGYPLSIDGIDADGNPLPLIYINPRDSTYANIGMWDTDNLIYDTIENQAGELVYSHGVYSGPNSVRLSPSGMTFVPLNATAISVSASSVTGRAGDSITIQGANTGLSSNGNGGDVILTAGSATGNGGSDVIFQSVTHNQGSGSSMRLPVESARFYNGNFGIGTSTPVAKLHVTSGASATTTVTIGELGLSTSKACVNMNRSNGGAASFYINAAGTLVVETNYCR